jgi:hypothetical protein
MYFLLQFVAKKIKTMNKTNSYDCDKSCHLLIHCLNTIGSQQKNQPIKANSYLLNLQDHIIDL